MSYKPLTKRDIALAIKRTKEADAVEPRIDAAAYDAQTGNLVLRFRDGQTVTTPARAIKGLELATNEQLTEAIARENGASLHFDTLDQQYSTIALLRVIFKIPSQSEAARKAGSTTSPAKAAAARANGAKGGRPRKTPIPV